jgi:hypothetical protein
LFGEDQVSIRYHMLSTTYQDGRMKVGRLRSHGNARRFWGPDAHALGLTHAGISGMYGGEKESRFISILLCSCKVYVGARVQQPETQRWLQHVGSRPRKE